MDISEKTLLGDKTEKQILDYIINQPIEIGSKIPNEFKLAEIFGVGRSTIREAVKSLASKGILEVIRGSGTYVRSTELPENDPLGLGGLEDRFKLSLDLCDVRLLIEPEIAAMASKNATEDEIQTLKRLCQETEELYLSGQNHIYKDIEFHSYIAKCSRNRVIETIIPLINTAVITFGNVTRRMLLNETISTHKAVMDAIENRDPVGAKCAMIMHLTYNRQLILKLMNENQ